MKENLDLISKNNKSIVCPLCDQDLSHLKEKINIHLEQCCSSMLKVFPFLFVFNFLI